MRGRSPEFFEQGTRDPLLWLSPRHRLSQLSSASSIRSAAAGLLVISVGYNPYSGAHTSICVAIAGCRSERLRLWDPHTPTAGQVIWPTVIAWGLYGAHMNNIYLGFPSDMSKRVRLGRTSPAQNSHTYEMAHLRGVGCIPAVGPPCLLTLMIAQSDF
ncbi:hypothetical protein GY45DRAFT_767453 [Cubamyces sp. BRFM 1775]|nr:hypothetical protein GY45DRAFT_767453 [Cubamyces sp. BRFM 1775]